MPNGQRTLEVTTGVLESMGAIAFDPVENRLHTVVGTLGS
jgi:ornithine carbamoyltransferase